METIDINKVAGLQALDSEGNVLGVVSMEQLTEMVAGKLATELAAQNTAPAMRTMSLQASPAAASVSATGVDKSEQQLLDVSDPKYVRVIGPDGNSGKQGISQFASVVGELLPDIDEFINNIGGLTCKGDAATTRITEQGVFRCLSTTLDIPEDLISGILISIKGHISDAYMVYFLFDLRNLKRYTRLKIDSYYSPFSEF